MYTSISDSNFETIYVCALYFTISSSIIVSISNPTFMESKHNAAPKARAINQIRKG